MLPHDPQHVASEVKPFFVEGVQKHSSGCTISDWLNDIFKHQLALYFCENLRKELVIFISPPVLECESESSEVSRVHRLYDSQESLGFDSSSASNPMSSSASIGESDSASGDLD